MPDNAGSLSGLPEKMPGNIDGVCRCQEDMPTNVGGSSTLRGKTLDNVECFFA